MKVRWLSQEETNVFEMLDSELDRTKANQTDWLVSLQQIREATDNCYNAGEIAEYQWRVLVNKAARIQAEKATP